MGRGSCGRAACTLSPNTMKKATGATEIYDEQEQLIDLVTT
jgi:hypothetical protein